MNHIITCKCGKVITYSDKFPIDKLSKCPECNRYLLDKSDNKLLLKVLNGVYIITKYFKGK